MTAERTYDVLSELVGPELSQALAAELLPKESHVHPVRGGLFLVNLANNHFGDDKLLCADVPADELIPHRYEGGFQWFDGIRQATIQEPVWYDGGILERFGNCHAIYA